LVDGLKGESRQVAVRRALVRRRLLAFSQDGPSADRGNKEARLGFVVSSLRCE
jgi:hypothetical protein